LTSNVDRDLLQNADIQQQLAKAIAAFEQEKQSVERITFRLSPQSAVLKHADEPITTARLQWHPPPYPPQQRQWLLGGKPAKVCAQKFHGYLP
jgi:hypothetical protein